MVRAYVLLLFAALPLSCDGSGGTYHDEAERTVSIADAEVRYRVSVTSEVSPLSGAVSAVGEDVFLAVTDEPGLIVDEDYAAAGSGGQGVDFGDDDFFFSLRPGTTTTLRDVSVRVTVFFVAAAGRRHR